MGFLWSRSRCGQVMYSAVMNVMNWAGLLNDFFHDDSDAFFLVRLPIYSPPSTFKCWESTVVVLFFSFFYWHICYCSMFLEVIIWWPGLRYWPFFIFIVWYCVSVMPGRQGIMTFLVNIIWVIAIICLLIWLLLLLLFCFSPFFVSAYFIEHFVNWRE